MSVPHKDSVHPNAANEGSQARRALIVLQRQQAEAKAIWKVMARFQSILEDTEAFWRAMDQTLDEICRIIGASCAAIVVYEDKGSDAKPICKAVANLDRSAFVGKSYPASDPVLRKALRTGHTGEYPGIVVNFDEHAVQESICYDISQLTPAESRPQRAGLVPLELGNDDHGVLLFFLSESTDTISGLEIEDELLPLLQITPQIATAYQYCRLYEERKNWLEMVSHQMVAPLQSIAGHAERLHSHVDRWRVDKPTLINSTTEALSHSALHAARFARNFAWIASPEAHKHDIRLGIARDMRQILIDRARVFQGLAAERGIYRVHVEETVNLLSGKVRIYKKLFDQAVENLLDNAVKYSVRGSEVLITGSLSESEATIHIVNTGIPILESDVDRIFERGFRTKAAQARYRVGTGIGLTIARDIILLHKGHIDVGHSVPLSEDAHRVEFKICMPTHE